MYRVPGLIAMLLITATPAWSQNAGGLTIEPELEQLPPPRSTGPSSRPGQLADSAVGQAGVRQTRAQPNGVDPMARLNSRIQNRVEARINNRIDRIYNPRTNTTSSFERAGNEVEQSGKRAIP